MKLTIIVVGKTEKGFVLDGIEEYLKRLKRYIKTEIVVIPDLKKTRGLSTYNLIAKEEELILASVSKHTEVTLLDERGKQFSSMELARWLEQKMISGLRELVLIIGGAYGVSTAVKEKVQEHISLSSLTFSHQMARLILVEQLYRAMTIIKGEPYHHE